MSIRKLLAESRVSGPATCYDLADDGTILAVTVRPARGPYTPSTLTIEEHLTLLTLTGSWGEDFPAAANCGVQKNDFDFHKQARTADKASLQAITQSGILLGYKDPTGLVGGHKVFDKSGSPV